MAIKRNPRWKVIRGEGWGPLVIGADLSAIERQLGKAKVLPFGDNFIAQWKKLGIEAQIDRDKTVTSIDFKFVDVLDEFGSFRGQAQEGVSARSSMADVEAAYGPAPQRNGRRGEFLIYDGFSFYFDKKLEVIGIDPKRVPIAKKPLPPVKSSTLLEKKVIGLVDALETRIAELSDRKIRLVFKPVRGGEVEAFEQQLGMRLPPSYRRLLLERGTFHVQVYDYRFVWLFSFDDLGTITPTAWADQGNPSVDRAVDEAIYFAYDNDDAVENYVAFNPRARTADGEMGVVRYFHDERFALGRRVRPTFAEYLEQEIDELFEDLIPSVV